MNASENITSWWWQQNTAKQPLEEICYTKCKLLLDRSYYVFIEKYSYNTAWGMGEI